MTDARTACEEYGHRFKLGDEQFDACTDCGEPREKDPCDVCGREGEHEHENLAWDDVWGLVEG